MRSAADELLAVLDDTASRGQHIIGLLIGEATFTVGDHYPPDDVYDHATGAGFFYHAHPADPRPRVSGPQPLPEHGHFHLFVNRRAVPRGVKPLKRPGRPTKNWGLCHLAAIAMDVRGVPSRVFTTNLQLCQEWVYPAPVVIDMLDRFEIGDPCLRTPVSAWVTSMAALFRPQIVFLLRGRDRILAPEAGHCAFKSADRDEPLEITSHVEIDIDRQIATVDRALKYAKKRGVSN